MLAFFRRRLRPITHRLLMTIWAGIAIGFVVAARHWLGAMRVIVQSALAFLSLGAVLILVYLVIDALRERGIRIEPLSVPRELSEDGVTGEAVANQIITRLVELDRGSASVRPADRYSKDWAAGDIRFEFPESGVAVGGLSHFLNYTFGRATRVGGEVVHANGEMRVVIRTDDDAVEAKGPDTDVLSVVDQAAERFYAWRQPYRYGRWLAKHGHIDSSNSVYRRMIESGSSTEQIWGRAGIAENAATAIEQIDMEERLLELDPGFLLARTRLAELEALVGHDDKALAAARTALEDKRRLLRDDTTPEGRSFLLARAASVLDSEVADFRGLQRDAVEAEQYDKPARSYYELQKALAFLHLHDLKSVEAIFETLPYMDPATIGGVQRSELLALLAAEKGDWNQALMVSLWAASSTLPEGQKVFCRSHLMPLLAESYARTGLIESAESVLNNIPPDVYDAWRVRGKVARLQGNPGAAAEDFAEAIRQAPSNARAYKDWGDMLYSLGDLKGAILKYKKASQLAPNWADPVKGWADALAGQQDDINAIAKYQQAAELAPHWNAPREALEAQRRRTDLAMLIPGP